MMGDLSGTGIGVAQHVVRAHTSLCWTEEDDDCSTGDAGVRLLPAGHASACSRMAQCRRCPVPSAPGVQANPVHHRKEVTTRWTMTTPSGDADRKSFICCVPHKCTHGPLPNVLVPNSKRIPPVNRCTAGRTLDREGKNAYEGA